MIADSFLDVALPDSALVSSTPLKFSLYTNNTGPDFLILAADVVFSFLIPIAAEVVSLMLMLSREG